MVCIEMYSEFNVDGGVGLFCCPAIYMAKLESNRASHITLRFTGSGYGKLLRCTFDVWGTIEDH